MTEVQFPKEAQFFLFATLRLAMGIRGSLPEMLEYEAGHSLEVKNA